MVVRKNAARSVKSGLVPLSDQPPGYNMWSCEVPALPLAYVSGRKWAGGGGGLSRDVGRGDPPQSECPTSIRQYGMCKHNCSIRK